MDQWYVPITIVPAVGLLLLSTSHLLVALSSEIKGMFSETHASEALIKRKLRQLKLLSSAMVLLYLSVACFVVAGLIAGLYFSSASHASFSVYITMCGIATALLGLFALIVYAIRAVKIRQDQFHNQC